MLESLIDVIMTWYGHACLRMPNIFNYYIIILKCHLYFAYDSLGLSIVVGLILRHSNKTFFFYWRQIGFFLFSSNVWVFCGVFWGVKFYLNQNCLISTHLYCKSKYTIKALSFCLKTGTSALALVTIRSFISNKVYR